jgi:hypothetical protein
MSRKHKYQLIDHHLVMQLFSLNLQCKHYINNYNAYHNFM